jgi:carbon storage regulator CsrA
MLTLKRRKGETVEIADGTIRVTVLEITEGAVSLGFEAPEDVDIWRSEIKAETTEEIA